jgi:hypothetical protein
MAGILFSLWLLGLWAPSRPLFAPSGLLLAVGVALVGMVLFGLWLIGEQQRALGINYGTALIDLGPYQTALDALPLMSRLALVGMPLGFLLLGGALRIRARVWRGLIWGAATYLVIGLGLQATYNVWWRDDLFAPHPGAFMSWPFLLGRIVGWLA